MTTDEIVGAFGWPEVVTVKMRTATWLDFVTVVQEMQWRQRRQITPDQAETIELICAAINGEIETAQALGAFLDSVAGEEG